MGGRIADFTDFNQMDLIIQVFLNNVSAMEPKLMDHAFVLLLAVVAPIQARREMRRLLSAPQPQGRRRAWKFTILSQWGAAAVLVVWWLYAGRPLPALGLGPSGGPRLAFAIGVLLAVIGFFGWQLVAVKRRSTTREQVRKELAPLEALLPHEPGEVRLFSALAVTAGICEELLYRGFLFWYFAHFGGTALAIIGSTLIFMVGHLYQGASGLVKSGVGGLAMAGLRVLTGSVWVPMAVHGAVDLFGGWTAHAALRPEPQTSAG
jgi:membrane protease YdiL (CAAX protease family)